MTAARTITTTPEELARIVREAVRAELDERGVRGRRARAAKEEMRENGLSAADEGR